MAYPRLYTCDLARGRCSSAMSDIDSLDKSAQNAVDGDPNSIWAPGTGATTFGVTLDAPRKIRAFAFANHNLAGCFITLLGVYNGSGIVLRVPTVVPTCEDFLVDLETSTPLLTAAWVTVTGADPTIRVGCISVLGDYGYNSAGQIIEGGGYGIIELGGDDVGGVSYPLPVGGDTGVVAVTSANGFPQYQRLAGVSQSLVIPFDLMRAARDYDLWRLFQAYYPQRRGVFANPGFTRGVWYTSDDYSTDAPTARYCVGDPSRPLAYQIDQAGSRASGSLVLQTIPRDPVS